MKMNKILLYSASVLGLGLGFLGLSQDASAAEITVQSGDTLSKIAQTHNTTVDSLVAINGIANPNLIFVGEVLQTEGTNVATVQETQTYVEPTQTYVEPTQTYTEPVQETQTSYSSTATGSEYESKEWIANKESGGSYTASNGQYYGRYQLNPSLYAGYDTTPAGQEAAAQAYVDARYGGSWVTAKNFWLANGWY